MALHKEWQNQHCCRMVLYLYYIRIRIIEYLNTFACKGMMNTMCCMTVSSFRILTLKLSRLTRLCKVGMVLMTLPYIKRDGRNNGVI